MIFLYQDYKEFDLDGQANFVLCNVYLDTDTNEIVYVPVTANFEQNTPGESNQSKEFPTIIDNLLK